jgi:hypothetical protein
MNCDQNKILFHLHRTLSSVWILKKFSSQTTEIKLYSPAITHSHTLTS